MDIERAFYRKLMDCSDLRSVVSSRIFPLQSPIGTEKPYVIYQRISTTRSPHLGGSSGLVTCRMQVTIVAETLQVTLLAADAIRSCLDGWRGTSATVDIRSMFIDSAGYAIDAPIDGSDRGVLTHTMDFTIWYRETIPAHNV